MEKSSMTALVSSFARAYHAREEGPKIFDDSMAEALLGEAEYAAIAGHMADGIGYFCPGFSGSRAEALGWVVRHRLASYPPGPGRARAGLFPSKNLRSIPADLSEPGWPKALEEAGFDRRARSFCSLLGLVWYLSPEAFGRLLVRLSAQMPQGSSLAFDYPVRSSASPEQSELARAAGEEMQGTYTRGEIELLLAETGFLAYEHPGPSELTARFFQSYNAAHPDAPMAAEARVNCCLAVRQK
ncbi:MAG: class I SAM-dependent methyltransferase [Pseudoflavonifractor sp.]|nr:class I SAM-dependent methyltransferase [Pseudoflavonifractor sp.]